MADNLNQVRQLRILELLNDYRTLKMHINSLTTRPSATAPDKASYPLIGYALLRQCSAEAQVLLNQLHNPSSPTMPPGSSQWTEAQRVAIQKIILDVSSKRLSAHKMYLRAAAGTRWTQSLAQIRAGRPVDQSEAVRAIDQRLTQELANITDQHVYNDLEAADRRNGYWIDEDPSLDQILAWLRQKRTTSSGSTASSMA